MKINIKALCEELGFVYEISNDNPHPIHRGYYQGELILFYDEGTEYNFNSVTLDIDYPTDISDDYKFINWRFVYNDDYNYNWLKNHLINMISKYKQRIIGDRMFEMNKDFENET